MATTPLSAQTNSRSTAVAGSLTTAHTATGTELVTCYINNPTGAVINLSYRIGDSSGQTCIMAIAAYDTFLIECMLEDTDTLALAGSGLYYYGRATDVA